MKTERKTITITCDICKKDITQKGYKLHGGLTIRKYALDIMGNPAADGTISCNEVCDNCIEKLVETYNKLKSAMQK